MEYVPKHTTEIFFFMILMVKSWRFVMFVVLFLVETFQIFSDVLLFYSADNVSGFEKLCDTFWCSFMFISCYN